MRGELRKVLPAEPKLAAIFTEAEKQRIREAAERGGGKLLARLLDAKAVTKGQEEAVSFSTGLERKPMKRGRILLLILCALVAFLFFQTHKRRQELLTCRGRPDMTKCLQGHGWTAQEAASAELRAKKP